jgi:hypothetical protein
VRILRLHQKWLPLHLFTLAGTRPQLLEHERYCVQFVEGQSQEFANPPASPCGGRKLTTPAPAPAGELYIGSYHLACRRAAAALTRPDRILILSALHGLLPLDRVIAPYDLRMGQPGSIRPAELRSQAEQLHLVEEPRVIILAGQSYSAAALSVWPAAATPLAGVGGLGYQLALLAGIAQSDATAGHSCVGLCR